MNAPRQPCLASRLAGFGTTIFTEMTRLALEHSAVNLAQGFPDFDGPDFVKRAAIAAIDAGHNQYCRMFGLPALNASIAAHQRRFYDLDFDPEREVTVFAGATEAIFASLMALCEPGDEVILFEPFYDSYRAGIAMAGAVERVVTLHHPGFRVDAEQLARAVSPRTRAILVNSPHNPTGRVLDRDELETIAALCRRHGLIAITDEVYEHLTYGPSHVPLATLPGMRDRTVTISSLGKTFSFTGWKIGWACATPEISTALRTAHQFITFTNGTPFQHAAVVALGADDAFYRTLATEFRARRDKLVSGLQRVGFAVTVPDGTYFAVADIRSVGYDDDVEFCRMLPARYGVAAIPTTAFYLNKSEGRHLVRFVFCKTDAVLEAGLQRLAALEKGSLGA